MPDRMHEKLGAYLDGELQGPGLRAVESHLETCPACREELEALRRLSRLLHAAPQPAFTPASRFTSQLMLRLPRREGKPSSGRAAHIAAWAFPAAILLAWAFVQTTFSLAKWLTIALQAGIINNTAGWIPAEAHEMGWFTGLRIILGDSVQRIPFESLNDAGLVLQGLAVPLICEFILVSFYWAWLVLWWQHRQKQPLENTHERYDNTSKGSVL
ncbi:MAG: anti-sigma factor family protein [Chloroflexota bacterium]